MVLHLLESQQMRSDAVSFSDSLFLDDAEHCLVHDMFELHLALVGCEQLVVWHPHRAHKVEFAE
jgi:hypothetical protein